jgi:hypothetical protein
MSFDRKVTLIEVGPLAVIPTSLASALSGTYLTLVHHLLAPKVF